MAPTAVLLTSCGAVETAGLKELVEVYRPQVVASAAGLNRIKESCPDGTVVLSAEESPDLGWFKVRPIPLRGPGLAPIAFEVTWTDKTVLFSGRVPIKINHETWPRLEVELSKSKEATLEYVISVDKLGDLRPDLWLPAVPADGQNANLYGDEWQDLITDNFSLRSPQ